MYVIFPPFYLSFSSNSLRQGQQDEFESFLITSYLIIAGLHTGAVVWVVIVEQLLVSPLRNHWRGFVPHESFCNADLRI